MSDILPRLALAIKYLRTQPGPVRMDPRSLEQLVTDAARQIVDLQTEIMRRDAA